MVAVSTEQTKVLPRTHRFSVADYRMLGEHGILAHDSRTELIEGEVLDRSPVGPRHSNTVDRLAEWLVVEAQQKDFKVRIQNPLTLGETSEPQPDVALVERRDYANDHPGPADVYLIIEVAESTLAYDRAVKSQLYAVHGVPEYWLVDLTTGRVELYREPTASGYRSMIRPELTERISPLRLPELTVTVAMLVSAEQEPG